MTFIIVSAPDTLKEPQIDFSEIHDRFDTIDANHVQVKIGIVNSSIDFCFSNGGTYLTDASGNIMVQESQSLDQNTGQIAIIRFIPCILG